MSYSISAEMLPSYLILPKNIIYQLPNEGFMSGTGGTVYDPTPPRSACDRLTFRTVLNSPVPSVVRDIQARHSHRPVSLEISTETRQGGLQIAVAVFEGQRAGAITSDALARLLECMAQGNNYVADVLSVAGARVEVQVKRL